MQRSVVTAFELAPGERQLATDLVQWSSGGAPNRSVALTLTDRRVVLVFSEPSDKGLLRRVLATMSTRRVVVELRQEDLVRVDVGDGSLSGPTWLALHDRDGSVLEIGVRDVTLWLTRLERWRDEAPPPAPLPEARARSAPPERREPDEA